MKNHLSSHHPSCLLASESSRSSSVQSLDNFVIQKKCPAERSKEITKRIAEMVARDLRPLSIVEGEGFKRLMNYVEPGYTVPSHTHITTICRHLYSELKEKLILEIASCKYVALTTDIWTSAVVQGFITLTAHYITDSWELCSKVLLTEEIPERHTGKNISDRLTKAIDDWAISASVISACVHDNASNAVNGLELTGWPHFGCVAHTLQLCINAGLEVSQISQMTAVARKLVSHFRHSVVAMTGLREKQTQLDVPQHNLLQDVSTRWNSTYFMLDRLLEQRVAIYATLHDINITKPQYQSLDLKDNQWDLLSQMVVVLKPLQVATTVFSSDLNISCSIIYPVVQGLLTNHMVIHDNDLPVVKKFKETVSKELKRRFDPSSLHVAKSLPVLCAAIDPRYSQLSFLNEEQREIAYAEIIKQMEAMQTSEKDEVVELSEPPAKKSKDSAIHFLLGDTVASVEPGSMTCLEEMEYFKKEPALGLESDVLEWWRKNQERFPHLQKSYSVYLLHLYLLRGSFLLQEALLQKRGQILNLRMLICWCFLTRTSLLFDSLYKYCHY